MFLGKREGIFCRYQIGYQKPQIEEGQTIQWPKVWRYQGGNQKSSIDEWQTIQWPKEKKDKMTNSYLQNTTQKTNKRLSSTQK